MAGQFQKQPEAIKTELEAKQNLLGFFDLLLEIDIRNNPELYKEKPDKDNDDNRNTNFTNKA